jgi:hypothetical protein
MAVARPTVAGLAMGLLAEDPHAVCDVGWIRALRQRGGAAGQHADQDGKRDGDKAGRACTRMLGESNALLEQAHTSLF